jgi:hypothetical protein
MGIVAFMAHTIEIKKINENAFNNEFFNRMMIIFIIDEYSGFYLMYFLNPIFISLKIF